MSKPPRLTITAITAMVRTNMAAIAHVFLAQRVRSIHKEKDTSFLEKNYPQNCYGHRQTQKDIFACCVYPGEDGS